MVDLRGSAQKLSGFTTIFKRARKFGERACRTCARFNIKNAVCIGEHNLFKKGSRSHHHDGISLDALTQYWKIPETP